MKTVWNIAEILSTCVENIIIIHFLFCFFKPKKQGIGAYISAIGGFAVLTAFIMVLNNYYAFENYLVFASIAICVAYSAIFLKGKIETKILVMVALATTIFIINMLVNVSFGAIYNQSAEELLRHRNIVRLFALVITKGLFAIVCTFALDAFSKRRVYLNRRNVIGLSFIFTASLVTGLFIIKMRIDDYLSGAYDVVFFITLLTLLAVNVLSFWLINRISKDAYQSTQISMMKLQLEERRSEIQTIKDTYNDIKKTRHDMKNWLTCAAQLIHDGKVQRAEEYIEKLINDKVSGGIDYANTDNESLNAILNNKKRCCANFGIECDYLVTGTVVGFEDVDLSILIANLLDNAIEAEKKTSNPRIVLQMYDETNHLKIVVMNKIDESVLLKNKTLSTTKENKKLHGLGLDSVKDIVKKYNGMIDIYENNGYFIVDCWIYLVDKK